MVLKFNAFHIFHMIILFYSQNIIFASQPPRGQPLSRILIARALEPIVPVAPNAIQKSKPCLALVGLIVFTTLIGLKLTATSNPPQSHILPGDDCNMNRCSLAFAANGSLVSAGNWGAWIKECNGKEGGSWCGEIPFCSKPYRYNGSRKWNPANVTRDKMIERIASYCRSYESICFGHCDFYKNENCNLDPLDIVHYLPRSGCAQPSDNNEKQERLASKGQLKEQLKVQNGDRASHKNAMEYRGFKNKFQNRSMKLPRQRSKK